MTPALLRLAAHLLAEAAAEFANHGCNDLDVSKHLDAEDQDALARAAWEWNGSQPDEDPSEVPGSDWIVMHALARMLVLKAGSAP